MNHEYFIHNKTKDYFFIGETTCCKCNNHIYKRMILVCEWSRKSQGQFYHLCIKCLSLMPQIKEIQEQILFNVVDTLPQKQNCDPWIPTPPQLCNASGDDVFEAATAKSDGKVIDNTRYSGRSGYTFGINDKRDRIPISELQDQNAIQEVNARIDELESDVHDVDGFFEEIKSSTLAIKEEKRRLLE